MKKEEFLRRIFSVDAEAGYKLHYKITKATCNQEYAAYIEFNKAAFNSHTASDILLYLFTWKYTPQGERYWSSLHDKVRSSILQKGGF